MISVHIHSYTYHNVEELAETAGYQLEHIAGLDLLNIYGSFGGPFGVFKDGKLLNRFESAVARDKWLYEVLKGERK